MFVCVQCGLHEARGAGDELTVHYASLEELGKTISRVAAKLINELPYLIELEFARNLIPKPILLALANMPCSISRFLQISGMWAALGSGSVPRRFDVDNTV